MCSAEPRRGRTPTRPTVRPRTLCPPRRLDPHAPDRAIYPLPPPLRSQLSKVHEPACLLPAAADPLGRRADDHLLQVHRVRDAMARGLSSEHSVLHVFVLLCMIFRCARRCSK